MGLDVLDVTFRIEKAFQIELRQEDLQGLVRDGDITVGDLYQLILTKMHLRDVGRYDIRLNEQLWLGMKFVLHSASGTPWSEIQLGLPLETLFPLPTRRAKWTALRTACPYRIPELDYPRIVRVSGLLVAGTMVLFEQFQIWQNPGLKFLWPAVGILGIWVFGETYLKILSICAPLRNRFPARMKTVKDLCRSVLARNYAEICNTALHALDQRHLSVWEKLVEQLVVALGVDADEVTFQSRLYRDLAME